MERVHGRGSSLRHRRPRIARRLVRRCLLSAVWCCVFATSGFAELLPVKTYTVADGALRDAVQRIRKDANGFLWLCSYDGISRFDGYTFTNFTTADGLPARHVNDFLHSRSGKYWVATNAGLALLNPQGLRNSTENPMFTVFLPPNARAKRINVLHEDNGGIWVGTYDGLYVLSETGSFAPVDLPRDPANNVMNVTAILRDRLGVLWVATTTHGLFRIPTDGEVEQFGTMDGLPSIGTRTLLEDSHGRIWVGLREQHVAGLCRLVADPQKGRPIVDRIIERTDGLPAYWTIAIYQSADGQIWVGTTSGLCRVGDDEKLHCERYKTANNLCDEQVWSIIADHDENLWLGTKCGTKKWSRHGFTSYSTADGLAHREVASVFENAAGDLFAAIGWQKSPISRFDGERFSQITPNLDSKLGSGWGWKQTVWQDSRGEWWFPTAQGLYRFSAVRRVEDLATARPEKVTIPGNDAEIFRVFEDGRGDIWVQTWGAPTELRRFERATGVWHNHTAETGISPRLATAFLADRQGNLWIATGSDGDEAALIRYREGRFDVFTGADNELIAGWLRDLYLDEAGRLWIAGNATGLLRLDDLNTSRPEFVRYTAAEGLSSTGVYCVTGDEFGRIYVGSGRGIDRLDPATGQIKNFTTADGLPSSEVWTAYRDRKEQLWFATSHGLARLIPEPQRVRQPPSVFISAFRVLGEARPVSVFGETELPTFDLASHQQQITIEFLGLGSSIGEKLRYEYRLADSDWTPAEGRSVNFATLPAGRYRFEIRAVTADSLFSLPAVATFTIAAPLWQRWWFISVLAIGVTAFTFLFYRVQLARAVELERVRTRIATDLHDDIGANLTRIALLSEVANQRSANAGARDMLQSVANIARESVASMNDIVWAVSPEHDSLRDLVSRMRRHAEEVFAARIASFSFTAPPAESDLKLSVGVRRDLLLIFKEAVNNAARHSGAAEVSIDFQLENGYLTLTVADKGKGFDSRGDYEGQGLRSMLRRAERLKGKLSLESGRGKGTIVRFKMPL